MAVLESNNYTIYINQKDALLHYIQDRRYSRLGILVDENTKQHCLPLLPNELINQAILIEIKSGEEHKTIKTCELIWSKMVSKGFDRSSLLINLGGGVIGDMGGFCAATYMRGIDFIHVPTTLLSQVDASVGGKLGIDFRGLKNMVGLFTHPQAVIVHTDFLETLPAEQKRSGYAEMIKHGLVYDRGLYESYTTIEESISKQNIIKNIAIKDAIVKKDFKEAGLRKVLNFAHTVGHAIESNSFSTIKPLLHGEAIAIGMIIEAHLSHKKTGLNSRALIDICDYIIDIYGHHPQYLEDRVAIIEHILHDKKNHAGDIRVSLLSQIGHCEVDISCSQEEIIDSLDYYCKL